jgi:hypothetical protein
MEQKEKATRRSKDKGDWRKYLTDNTST